MTEREKASSFIKRGLQTLALTAILAAMPAEVAAQPEGKVTAYPQCGSTELPYGLLTIVERVENRGRVRFVEYPLGHIPGHCGNPEEEQPYMPDTSVRLSKKDKNDGSGLVFGPRNIWVNCPSWAKAFEFISSPPSQGQGIHEISGGLNPEFPMDVRFYINSNKPKGFYSGNEVLVCVTENGTRIPYQDNRYTLELTD